MENQVAAVAQVQKPLWRRIVDYPLVAMVLSIIALLASAGLAAGMVEILLRGSTIQPDVQTMLMDLAGAAAMVIVYKLLVPRLGEIRRDDLRSSGAIRLLAIGLGVAFILFSFIVGIAALLGVYRVEGPGDASFLLFALVTDGLFPAISEELLFRGVLFRWLEEFGGSWVALLLTSAFFGAAHLSNPHASPVAAVGIAFEAGVMLGAAYMLTRSLWLPMGLHAAWNITQGEIFDIPVSGTPVHGMVVAKLSGPPLLTGNGFGLEASLIAIVFATLFGLWLLWLAIRKGELMQPHWVRRRRLGAPA
jgi:uncharacterized protein